MATDSSLLVHASALLFACSGETIAVSVADWPSLSVISVSLRTIPETSFTTFTVHEAEIFDPSVELAVITAVPLETAITLPFWLTVATDSLLLAHASALLFACSGDTVALNSRDWPSVSVAFVMLSEILSTSFITVSSH